MLHLMMVILAVAGGALLSVQAAVNARLSLTHGVLRTTFLTFLVGTAFSVLLVLFLEPRHAITLLDVPKWQLSAAFLGLVYVLVMVFAVQRIGTAIATIAVILGQLSMSMVIDTFGWLGNQAIAFSWYRFSAALCLAAALWFIYQGNNHPATVN